MGVKSNEINPSLCKNFRNLVAKKGLPLVLAKITSVKGIALSVGQIMVSAIRRFREVLSKGAKVIWLIVAESLRISSNVSISGWAGKTSLSRYAPINNR